MLATGRPQPCWLSRALALYGGAVKKSALRGCGQAAAQLQVACLLALLEQVVLVSILHCCV